MQELSGRAFDLLLVLALLSMGMRLRASEIASVDLKMFVPFLVSTFVVFCLGLAIAVEAPAN